MNLKLTRGKVNYISRLIVDYIQNNDEIDYSIDLNQLRLRVFSIVMDELHFFEKIEEQARQKIQTIKKTIPEGSQEWQILFKKYCFEALEKTAKNWN